RCELLFQCSIFMIVLSPELAENSHRFSARISTRHSGRQFVLRLRSSSKAGPPYRLSASKARQSRAGDSPRGGPPREHSRTTSYRSAYTFPSMLPKYALSLSTTGEETMAPMLMNLYSARY